MLGGGQAIGYSIGLGRRGFTWLGVQQISKARVAGLNSAAADDRPPAYLPRYMTGGTGNPHGARDISRRHRIHGTNAPETIGTRLSSGRIRLTNAGQRAHSRVNVGTSVIVLALDRRAGLGTAVP